MRKVTSRNLAQMKSRGEKITVLTAYDAAFAQIFDRQGVDVLLVGDSLGMVIQGQADTLSVTLEHIIYHSAAVARGAERALIVADMPFMTYQVSPEEALRNAGRLLAEGRAQAVKIEGGAAMAPTARRLVEAGIPVMGHLGLTPQSINQLGGFRVQGRDSAVAAQLLADAEALEAAGCFAVVLELIPGELAETVSQALTIPTIGIGAGVGCDGQVLVCYDMLGLNEGFSPKFLRTFGNLAEAAADATRDYVEAVRASEYPAAEHTFGSTPTKRAPAAASPPAPPRLTVAAAPLTADEPTALYGVPNAAASLADPASQN